MSIKIGFLGVQGAGKTTSLYGVAYGLKANKNSVAIVSEAAREARQRGFAINRDSQIESQLWMLGTQIQQELEAEKSGAKFILTDRTVYDVVAYASLFATPLQISILSAVALNYAQLKPYDLLIYFPKAEDPPEQDGVRDASVEFQDKVQQAMERVILPLALPIYEIVETRKSLRIADAFAAIKEQFDVEGDGIKA